MISSDNRNVFRGHLVECLEHFHDWLATLPMKGSGGSAEKRRMMSGFCQVSLNTVIAWLNGHQVPKGDPWLRLVCFLRLQGYSLVEFDRFAKLYQSIIELIGYGIMSVKEVSDVASLGCESHVYVVVRGTRGISEEKKRLLWEIWKSRRVELEQAKEQALKSFSTGVFDRKVANGSCCALPKSNVQANSKPLSPKHEKPSSDASFPISEEAVLKLMEALLAVLDAYLIEELPADKLRQLREKSGGTILRLSAHFNNLCSWLLSKESGGSYGG